MIFFGQEFSEQAISEAVKLAERTYPRECCGLFFRKGDSNTSTLFVPMTNHSSQSDEFEINELEHIALLQSQQRQGYFPTGFLHSHPDADSSLSTFDTQQFIIEGNYVLGSSIAFVLEVRKGHGKVLSGYLFSNETKGFSRQSSLVR